MSTTKKYQIQGQFAHPHIGDLIQRVLTEKGLSHAEVARRLGVRQTTFFGYIYQESIQFGILWKISIAVNYNFFNDLLSHLPEVVLKSNLSVIDKIVLEKDNEIADLRKEIEVYKGLLVSNKS